MYCLEFIIKLLILFAPAAKCPAKNVHVSDLYEMFVARGFLKTTKQSFLVVTLTLWRGLRKWTTRLRN